MRLAELDAVTIDAYGTLIRLADPVPALQEALAAHGIDREAEIVREAFLAEVRHYKPRSLRGGDPSGLASLRRECVAVFLETAEAGLEADTFVPSFVGALHFELLPGVLRTVDGLRARGLALAVVSNWDCELPRILAGLGLAHRFDSTAVSAVAGIEKPDPELFRRALEALGVEPSRAVHIGDSNADRDGAAAAGMRFAPAPLPTALAEWA